MSKHRSNARLFQPDGYTFRCWLNPEDARVRYERGELDLATNEAGQAIGYKLREAYQVSDPTRPRPSQSSITLTEIFLNVGLPAKADISPSQHAIEAARQKIAAWPYVWNERATKRRTEVLQ